MRIDNATTTKHNPGRGGQTEMTSDQTIFVRTIYMLSVRSNYMVWKGLRAHWPETCLIRGHLGLGRSDHRPIRAHSSLIKGRFELICFQIFFVFFTDRCCLCQESTIQQDSDQRLIESLMS